MNVYLIGMPGCGKSTISKELAAELNFERIDLDEQIVNSEGISIEKIFELKGEKYFREAERKALEKIALKKGVLVATGGGAPCFFDNIELMNNTGLTVFLDVPAETLVKRLLDPGQDVRPMVKGKSREDVFEFVNNKLQERIPYYSKAGIIVTGSTITSSEILQIISSNEIKLI